LYGGKNMRVRSGAGIARPVSQHFGTPPLMASFACKFLIKPIGKAIAADVPTLRKRKVSVKVGNQLPLLASRALAVIVRDCCHRILLWLRLSGAGM
jgi:hypothetical protein